MFQSIKYFEVASSHSYWGALHVMYVRNRSDCQVPWSCIYAIIQGSCHKHILYV